MDMRKQLARESTIALIQRFEEIRRETDHAPANCLEGQEVEDVEPFEMGGAVMAYAILRSGHVVYGLAHASPPTGGARTWRLSAETLLGRGSIDRLSSDRAAHQVHALEAKMSDAFNQKFSRA